MKIQESFLPSFHLLLHWVRQPFLGIPPFMSDPGSLCLFLYLECMLRKRSRNRRSKEILIFYISYPILVTVFASFGYMHECYQKPFLTVLICIPHVLGVTECLLTGNVCTYVCMYVLVHNKQNILQETIPYIYI